MACIGSGRIVQVPGKETTRIGKVIELSFLRMLHPLIYIRVSHAFFGVPGAQNDIIVLYQSPVFNQVLRGETNQITYTINNAVYEFPYYLVDGIYPWWTTSIKTIQNPKMKKEAHFSAKQEGYHKDVESCFGILQARWLIIRGLLVFFDQEVLQSIMMTCIILHNMIVED